MKYWETGAMHIQLASNGDVLWVSNNEITCKAIKILDKVKLEGILYEE